MLPKADTPWTLAEAAHLLNRAGFGGNPDEIARLHALGRGPAVDALLNPTEPFEKFPLPEWTSGEQAQKDFAMVAEKRRAFREKASEMAPEEIEKTKREGQKEYQQELRRRGLEAQGWWFRRMLMTEAPLREKMTLFWHDHFATSVQKVKQPTLMIHQNELFRRNAFGSWKDMTQSILMDGAMMLYLDTQTSKKDHPNENFAREVMELFTLGEGNYTEQDIHEAARAFTGYQFNRFNGKVTVNKRQWDETDKTIFGKTGPFDGKGVIDLIFTRKEPAAFMAKKLWEFFAYEAPPEAAVEALADSFQKSNYRVGELLKEIFLSKEFYSPAAMRSQIKSPIQYLVSMLKELELQNPPNGFPIVAQQQLGQILFLPPNVAGWDWGKAWINTNTLLTRYNLAGFLTKGASDAGAAAMADQKAKIPKTATVSMRGANNWKGPDYEKIAPRPLRDDPAKLVDSLVMRFFQGPVPDKARDSFVEYAKSKKGVIFTNQEAAELCHLILSTPYYQLC